MGHEGDALLRTAALRDVLERDHGAAVGHGPTCSLDGSPVGEVEYDHGLVHRPLALLKVQRTGKVPARFRRDLG